MLGQTSRACVVIYAGLCGMHARPAAMLVRVAKQYDAEIVIHNEDNGRANAKSILEVLSMGAEHGSALTVVAEGPDSEAAVKAVHDLFYPV